MSAIVTLPGSGRSFEAPGATRAQGRGSAVAAQSAEGRGVRMLLHAFVPASRANGPGLRAVVYFQGCSLQCPGCWNPSSHKFRGIEVTMPEVAQRFEEARRLEPLEGATFSGGEPMQQAEGAVGTDERDPQDRASGEPRDVHRLHGKRAGIRAVCDALGCNCGAEVRTLAGGSGASGLRGDGPLRSDPAVNCAAADEQKSKARTVQRPLPRGRLRTATRRNQHRGKWKIRTHGIPRARCSCLKRNRGSGQIRPANPEPLPEEPAGTRRIGRVDACLSRSGPDVNAGSGDQKNERGETRHGSYANAFD